MKWPECVRVCSIPGELGKVPPQVFRRAEDPPSARMCTARDSHQVPAVLQDQGERGIISSYSLSLGPCRGKSTSEKDCPTEPEDPIQSSIPESPSRPKTPLAGKSAATTNSFWLGESPTWSTLHPIPGWCTSQEEVHPLQQGRTQGK